MLWNTATRNETSSKEKKNIQGHPPIQVSSFINIIITYCCDSLRRVYIIMWCCLAAARLLFCCSYFCTKKTMCVLYYTLYTFTHLTYLLQTYIFFLIQIRKEKKPFWCYRVYYLDLICIELHTRQKCSECMMKAYYTQLMYIKFIIRAAGRIRFQPRSVYFINEKKKTAYNFRFHFFFLFTPHFFFL